MNKKINVKKRLYAKCVKEWEDDGWEWNNEEDSLLIVLQKHWHNDAFYAITLDKVDHRYFAQSYSKHTEPSFYALSQQEHKRLTKTFKALRW